jgi:endonuclease/exonuclease/phosphatase family metal-dependent hydrolase
MKVLNKILIIFLISLFFYSCNNDGKKKNKKNIIKAVTYNIHYNYSGTDKIFREIKKMKADIIALQEVPIQNGVDRLKSFSKRIGYNYVCSDPYVILRSGRRWVLSFMTIFKILSYSEIKLGIYRRALKVRLLIDSKPVEFVTLHLSPFILVERNLLELNRRRGNMRRREIADLVNWIKPDNLPLVIMGDFNSLPIMSELDSLKDSGFTDIFDIVKDYDSGTFPVKPYVLRKLKRYLPDLFVPKIITLDYILVNDSIHPLSGESIVSKSSDHYPLQVEFYIK